MDSVEIAVLIDDEQIHPVVSLVIQPVFDQLPLAEYDAEVVLFLLGSPGVPVQGNNGIYAFRKFDDLSLAALADKIVSIVERSGTQLGRIGNSDIRYPDIGAGFVIFLREVIPHFGKNHTDCAVLIDADRLAFFILRLGKTVRLRNGARRKVEGEGILPGPGDLNILHDGFPERGDRQETQDQQHRENPEESAESKIILHHKNSRLIIIPALPGRPEGNNSL